MDDIPVSKIEQKVLQVQLLGGFSISVDGLAIPETQWKSRRARNLVKLLALAPDHRLHRDQVIDTLWPDSDLTAATNNLHQTLYTARRVLEPAGAGALRLAEGFLNLSAGKEQAVWVDVEQFEAAAARAKDCQDPAVYQAALVFYQGDLLPDDLYEEWTIQRREALRQTHLNLLLDLARLLEDRQEYTQAIETLLRLLEADRSREEAHAGLMRLYALSGQRQQALRQYQALKEMLQAELDTEPSESTTQLYEAIQFGQFSSQKSTDFPLAAAVPSSALPTGTITFLFTDIEGSTTLWEQQPKAMPKAVARHHAILREIIEANGGVVFKVIGDQFQAAFRIAQLSLTAAIAAQRALQIEPWPQAVGAMRVRMGLHTGPAELVGDDYAVSHTLNRAARVMSAGFGGQILLSQETADLVIRDLSEEVDLQDLGENNLKGLQIPEHLFQVCAHGLPCNFPRLPTSITPKHNLPNQLTSFIGRDEQISEVSQLVKDHRLVTLTGAGGTGKTRLALKVAEELLDHFPDGIWYVELAPITDPEIVVEKVALSLGLQKTTTDSYQAILVNYLCGKKLLLLLDNCEHLLDACARLVNHLLQQCPQITLLTTSREALEIAGETAYRVPSLAAPDPDGLASPGELEQIESVRLFAERAAAAQTGFSLSPETLPSIAQICCRLDGIPLAIELAAARVGVLRVEQISSRLDDRFRLLTGGSRTALPRQRTLRASIDWSYSLLSEPERLLLQRLSVFSGGWTLAAAESVCSWEGLEQSAILDALAGLVNKSLVAADNQSGPETRYAMLETIRQYGQERLEDVGQGAAIRDRHLAYYITMAEEYEPLLHTAKIFELLDRLDLELDNLRGAIVWALGKSDRSGAEQALRILSSLFYFWLLRLSLFSEVDGWFNRAFKLMPEDDPQAVDLKAWSLLVQGILEPYFGNFQESLEHLNKCITLYRQAGDRPENREKLALALAVRMDTTYNYLWTIPAAPTVRIEDAQRDGEESLSIAQDLHQAAGPVSSWLECWVYFLNVRPGSFDISSPESVSSEKDRISHLLQSAYETSMRLGDKVSELTILSILEMAEIGTSTVSTNQGITLAKRLGNKAALSVFLCYLGYFSYQTNQFDDMQENFSEMFLLACQVGIKNGEIYATRMQGIAAVYQADIAMAQSFLTNALDLSIAHQDAYGILAVLNDFAGLALLVQQNQPAAWLLGCVERQLEGFFKPMDFPDQIEFERHTNTAREKLGEAAFTALWAEGRAMTMEQALQIARTDLVNF